MSVGGLPEEVVSALGRGAVVLTPNRRIAQALRHAFDGMQACATWEVASIEPLEGWLAGLWRRLLLQGKAEAMLLNATQERALWRRIIGADGTLSTVRPLDSVAELAQRAWGLLHLHGGGLEDAEFAVSADTRAFRRWAVEFARICEGERYLTAAKLPAALGGALAEGVLAIPDAGLVLVDFDQHPAAHEDLLESIRRAGYVVEEVQTGAERGEPAGLYVSTDATAELEAAAVWCRSRLERDAEARVAVVVPELGARRAEIARVFGRMVAPETQAITSPVATTFEFSLGVPLGSTAMAATAIDLLRWTLGALAITRISGLLLSPYFVGDGELTAAAMFDVWMRREFKLLRPEMTLDEFVRMAAGSRYAATISGVLQRLRGVVLAGAAAERPESYAAHAEGFREMLAAAGWAALSEASSLDFQARRRWESALDEMATLDFAEAKPAAAEALRALERIVGKTIFAAQTRHAAIQIMGPLEVGGVGFDALWFCSADSQSWPVAASPSPLLPRGLQRRLGMAAADAEVVLDLARTMTRRVMRAATEVVFSYAREAGDGLRRPSVLLRELELELVPESTREATARLELELIVDASVLPSLPDAVIRGGERIVADQAACGFRAFAAHRLGAAAPERRDTGLEPQERGSLVHRIMELFWAETQDQKTLRGMPALIRQTRLAECIDRALYEPERQVRSGWDAAYLEVERRRLMTLLKPWLEQELLRPAFRVQQQEQTLDDARLGPLRLKLRVDRVDDTAGGLLFLDYKTGVADPKDWLTDRPDSPQLPLYAVLSPAITEDRPLGGVAFAQLRAGDEMQLKGYAAHGTTVLPRPTRGELSLDTQREEWRRVLTQLAEAFAAGESAVAPKSYPKTCQWCAQRILCRLNLESLPVEDDLEPARG